MIKNGSAIEIIAFKEDEKMSLKNMIDLRSCNEKTIPCRFCIHCIKGNLHNRRCHVYDKKPADVYYDSVSCPKFEMGDDMIAYEIQI